MKIAQRKRESDFADKREAVKNTLDIITSKAAMADTLVAVCSTPDGSDGGCGHLCEVIGLGSEMDMLQAASCILRSVAVMLKREHADNRFTRENIATLTGMAAALDEAVGITRNEEYPGASSRHSVN